MPSPRISHMKSKRSWPGVPNRKRTRWRAMVIRPKSMATVVSVLRERVSSVMPFSVDSTVISLIVRMRVVLPAAKGPVTTILTAVPAERRRMRLVLMSQPPHAGNETQQQALVHTWVPFDVRRCRGCGRGRSSPGDCRDCGHRLLRVFRLALRQERLRPLGSDLRPRLGWHSCEGRRRSRLGRVLLVPSAVIEVDGGLRCNRRCGCCRRRCLDGNSGLERGEQVVRTQQCRDVIGIVDPKQAASDELGERGYDRELTATGQADDLSDCAATVDQREQGPLVAGQLRVGGKNRWHG